MQDWYAIKINQVFTEQKEVHDYLYKLGCKIDKVSSDDFLTEYQILYRGRVEIRPYGNIAFRSLLIHVDIAPPGQSNVIPELPHPCITFGIKLPLDPMRQLPNCLARRDFT